MTSVTNPGDYLLSVPEAAEFLNLSPGTVYHFISARKIPFIRISSRCIRFSRAALLIWLESFAHPAEPFVAPGPLLPSAKYVQRNKRTQITTIKKGERNEGRN